MIALAPSSAARFPASTAIKSVVRVLSPKVLLFTDVEDREQSYQSSLLELSNEIELAKSSFVEFKHKMSQNVAVNHENIQSHEI